MHGPAVAQCRTAKRRSAAQTAGEALHTRPTLLLLPLSMQETDSVSESADELHGLMDVV